ncbi:glycoside hydrolase family 125 protein [Paenibacillus sp. GCM10023248]|uniref:glycoside hydrolase family 125 protein n=1 Tax=unclassified Paenibacillus TaxID=185978 RepID=UPI002377DA70|nr:glycoside hydrolase family 125 protein [Paenibacillus sp. MAHUQ-63]MDD9268431.1 glycoside hydrolase family 125 protein [Paenibacillus sp. MAHUQ-63]
MYSAAYRKIEDTALRLQRIDPGLSEIFQKCYPNTLETTVEWCDDGTSFVITGDIPAMWLRDSSAQVRPYIQLATDDQDVRRLIRGVIERQARYLIFDPYANAFNKEPNGQGHKGDLTVKGPWVWERKYELDSLCYPVQLCWEYWEATQDRMIFTETVHTMFHRIIEVMHKEQRHDRDSSYSFERTDCPSSDTLPFGGRGTRTNDTGMIWSGFRPSDDACKFGYLIPSNMFAVVILRYIGRLAKEIYHDHGLSESAYKLSEEVEFGIETYGKIKHPVYGWIYAYETDGFGNYNLMDDANVPSLLSIPYLGYRDLNDPVYRNTRNFVLSPENPHYSSGRFAQGVGSPHTPSGHVWPIALIIQGLTSNDPSEQDALVRMLTSTTAGTGYMHESFHPDKPDTFTREWFAWANSLFGEFICKWLDRKLEYGKVVGTFDASIQEEDLP